MPGTAAATAVTSKSDATVLVDIFIANLLTSLSENACAFSIDRENM